MGEKPIVGARTDSQEIAEKIIEERVSRARKEEVLAVYEDLLQTIWNRILPTLGRVTVMAIVERSLTLTKASHPSLAPLQVTAEGLSFDALRQQVEDEERVTLRDALKELVANLIDILAMLTGDILVRQLIKEIEGGPHK
jgi:hypothetical protein